jgi:hypothetical protein
MAWIMHDAAGVTYNLLHSSGAQAMFRLKETLKHAGWTVLSSGDGTTYWAAADGITLEGSGAGGMNNNSAWFRITDPGAERELVFQRGAAHYTWTLQYSRLDKFVGGAPNATTIPTATDMVGYRSGGLSTSGTLFNTTAGTSWRVNIAVQTAAEGNVYAFWMTWRDTLNLDGRGLIFCDALDNTLTPAADDDQSIWYSHYVNTSSSIYIGGATASTGMSSEDAGAASFTAFSWQRYNEANEEWNRTICCVYAYYSTAGGITYIVPGPWLAVNPETNKYALLPLFWVKLRSTVTGYRGMGKYLRYNPRPDNLKWGDIISDSVTSDMYFIANDTALPGWPDASIQAAG